MATTRLYTIEDLEALPDDGHIYEVIDGELVRRPDVGGEHGTIGAGILSMLWLFVRDHALGKVFNPETIYVYHRNPDRSLRPDASFIRADRLPAGEAFRRPIEIAPDLVVEVVSPHDRADEIDEKIALYQALGVPLIWVFWPRRRAVWVYATGTHPRELQGYDELDGGDVLPGFRIRVADVFA